MCMFMHVPARVQVGKPHLAKHGPERSCLALINGALNRLRMTPRMVRWSERSEYTLDKAEERC